MRRFNILWIIPLILGVGCAPRPGEIRIGYGWSEKPEPDEAVTEAVEMAKEPLGAASPQLCILFSTEEYDAQALSDALKKGLGEGVKLWGCTSCNGVLTPDGFKMGEKGALACLLVQSPEISFGVGAARLTESESAQEAGRIATLSAIDDAGKTKAIPPKLVLLTAPPGEEEAILSGIEEVVGSQVPVIGGSSADNEIKGHWKQFANYEVYSDGVVVSVIYTRLKIGYAFQSRFVTTSYRGEVTRCDHRRIYEIDSRPAAAVYNEWLGGELSDVLKTGGNILGRTALHPLAKPITVDKETFYLSIHPEAFWLPERSLSVFAEVKEGDELILMRGTEEILIERPKFVAEKAAALGRFSKDKIAGGVLIYCAGTMLAIRDRVDEMVPKLKEVMGETPWIGAFTFGEQGMVEGAGNRHGNLLNTMVLFATE